MHHEGTKSTKTAGTGWEMDTYRTPAAKARADAPIHQAQLLTYLRISGRWPGLFLNFNTARLRNCLRRMVDG
jgi:PD-(D/E)XK nuclease superfamily